MMPDMINLYIDDVPPIEVESADISCSYFCRSCHLPLAEHSVSGCTSKDQQKFISIMVKTKKEGS